MTLSELFEAYQARSYYCHNDLLGVRALNGLYHWYRYIPSARGYIQAGSTKRPPAGTIKYSVQGEVST